MPIKFTDKILCFTDPNLIESEAKTQLVNVSELPFIFNHLAVMPDVHLGKGATVGSVIATQEAVIPAAVGVDIGCGIIAVETKFKANQLPDNLRQLRQSIERRIPLGAGKSNTKIHKSVEERVLKLTKDLDVETKDKLLSVEPNWVNSLGSLGGGNHFIEVCLDENDTVWITLHSGSRGIGNKLANKHIKIAQRLMKQWKIPLKDYDLSYLVENTDSFDNYIRDLLWSQAFARQNREEMMNRILTEFSYTMYGEDGHQEELEVTRINCHHNFTQKEHHMGKNVWLTRKGAIQAREGQLGVIPGSMSTETYIVEGLGHPGSFMSAPHGAGRRMSRRKARKLYTHTDLKKEMHGIESSRSAHFIDEIKMAYKDINKVIEDCKDLVQVKHTLKQILNVKGK